jgi:hypothetical protein
MRKIEKNSKVIRLKLNILKFTLNINGLHTWILKVRGCQTK